MSNRNTLQIKLYFLCSDFTKKRNKTLKTMEKFAKKLSICNGMCYTDTVCLLAERRPAVKKIFSAILALTLLFLSGCGGMSSLYCLPEPSDELLELQEALKEVHEDDLSYLVPTGGSRQEAVQLMDLDRDGTEEAVAFFRAEAGGIRMAVLSKSQEAYQVSALVECAGDAITSVDYRDLTGDGTLEIILSCQLSEVVTQGLYIYGYDGGAELLLSESCGRYCLSDLNGDNTAELYCIASSGPDTPAVVKSYQHQDGGFLWIGDQPLQGAYGGIQRIREETLSDGQKTLLITSLLADGTMVHDLLCTSGTEFFNLAREEDTALLKSGHIRGFYAYPQDMDGDGTVEFSTAEALPVFGDETPQYIIRWQGYSSDGPDREALLTYHNFSGLWYMTLPEAWEGNITIRQEEASDRSLVIFCRLTEEDPEPFLTIYTLKGAEGQAFVEEEQLTLITSDNDRIIAVGLDPNAENWDGTITATEAAERFHMIYSSEIIGQTE